MTPAARRPHHAGAAKRAEVAEVLDSLRRIVHALQRSHRTAEQRWDVSAAQLLVLQQLSDGAPLSINDLAERTFTHQSTVSVVVTRLVRRRLVRRTRADDDARRTEITLTPRGRVLLARAMQLAQTRLMEAIGRLNRTDRHSLASCLAVLTDELGVSEEPAGMFFEHVDGEVAGSDDGAAARRGRRQRD